MLKLDRNIIFGLQAINNIADIFADVRIYFNHLLIFNAMIRQREKKNEVDNAK
jgi:hypothetical protein